MSHFFQALFIFVLFCLVELGVHTQFTVCLYDDVEFSIGKKHLRNMRRKTKPSFLIRFFYWDIRHKVVRWHYVFFWIHIICFLPMVTAVILFAIYGVKPARIIGLAFAAVWFFTLCVISCVRWELYRGNKVRCRKDKERWRR